MRSWVRAIDPWLVAGAALCWVSVGMRVLSGVTLAYVPGLGMSALPMGVALAMGWGFAAFALLRRSRAGHVRVGLAALVLAASMALLVCDAVSPELPAAAGGAMLCLDALVLGVSSLLWAAAFATLGSRMVLGNAVASLLVAAVLVLVCVGASALAPLSWGADICSVGAAALLMSGRVPLRLRGRLRRSCPPATVAVLGAQRVLWGCTLGFFVAALLAGPGADAVTAGNPGLLLFSLTMLISAGLVAVRADVPLPTILPAMALAVAGLLCLPCVGTATGALRLASATLTGMWLMGQVTFSAQLAGLKRYLGLSELEVACADRLLAGLGMAVGCLAASLLRSSMPADGAADAWEAALLMALSVCALGAALSLARLGAVRQERVRRYLAERAAAEEVSEDAQAQRLDEIADEFDLMPREREVFVLLAQGYTGGFIAAEVGIALGTVKAHAAHIYQKLGVSHRDEMLELVERRSAGRS